MTTDEIRDRFISVFFKLREQGVALTIGDLIEALSMLERDWKRVPFQVLQKDIELLWCGTGQLLSLGDAAKIWNVAFGDLGTTGEAELVEAVPVETAVNATTVATALGSTDQVLTNEVQTAKDDSEVASTSESAITPAHSEPESKPEPEPDAETATEKPPVPREERPGGEGNRPHRRRFGNPAPIYRVREDLPAPMPSVSGVPVAVPMNKSSLPVGNEVFAYAPITRLSMAYAWRYLRRPILDGPADFLDVQATIDLVGSQGFFLAPIYKRRQSNHAHLITLIDRGGSMSPFQSITRDIVDTARQETSIREVNAFCFHNIVTSWVYKDEYLTKGLSVEAALRNCDVDTSILIVSDAGAARGTFQQRRVEETRQMLTLLKSRTPLVTWLNPMPKIRWKGSSASAIAKFSPMFQMDPDGFSSAIDALQGRGARS